MSNVLLTRAAEVDPLGGQPYNYTHFLRAHLIADAAGTLLGRGIQPGALAPDFTLPTANHGGWTLSQHRDRPVLLHLGSYT